MMGKSGMSPELVKQADDALEKRELIKGRVLPESSPMTSREAAEEIARQTGSDVVQVMLRAGLPVRDKLIERNDGRKFVTTRQVNVEQRLSLIHI